MLRPRIRPPIRPRILSLHIQLSRAPDHCITYTAEPVLLALSCRVYMFVQCSALPYRITPLLSEAVDDAAGHIHHVCHA